jgi:predicted GH43/DUF377 family glycosyl hydrolase
MADLAHRAAENPLLRPSDLRPSTDAMKIESLLNPGVFRFQDKIWLLVRVAERPEQTEGRLSLPILDDGGRIRILDFDKTDPELDLTDPRIIGHCGTQYLSTLSHLRLLASEDGLHFSEPAMPDVLAGQGELERWGIEDCRVAQIGLSYYLTYTGVSAHGVGVGMRVTRDWLEFEHLGMVLPPHNKDCCLFEERIHGKYYALHRPSSPELGGNYIWIGESDDLAHWGNHRCIAHSRPGSWDSARVGAGASPIRTPEGWLEIYHGATRENRYSLGALLLDLDEPWKVIGRSADPIMEPTEPYERSGFFGNVIFTNGHLVSGDRLTVYYGASDSVICSAEFSIAEILDSVRRGDIQA